MLSLEQLQNEFGISAMRSAPLVPSQCVAMSVSLRLVIVGSGIERNNRGSRNSLSDFKLGLSTIGYYTHL